MKFTEENRDLFTVGDDYYLVHCIASDLMMGAGIAVPMNKKFGLRSMLMGYNEDDLTHPTCILTGKVFNLITKTRSNHKPTMDDFLYALMNMRDMCVDLGIKKIAMPRIGCGLDKLSWNLIREEIKILFDNTDVEILICVK